MFEQKVKDNARIDAVVTEAVKHNTVVCAMFITTVTCRFTQGKSSTTRAGLPAPYCGPVY